MKLIKHKFFLTMFCLFSVHFSNSPILPEAIATTTLLKCGGVATALAVGGRYASLAVKQVSQLYQMRFKKVPQFEHYNASLDSAHLVGYNSDQANQNITTKKTEKSFLAKLQEVVSFRKEQQYQQESFHAAQGNTSWAQTNIQAQQARGFFPKVNNYHNHYYSGKSDFWQGATAGAFTTGVACCYVISERKKD